MCRFGFGCHSTEVSSSSSQTPIYVPAGGEVTVDMWRLSNKKKVWYEWCVTRPQVTEVHNSGGRSYWIGL